MSDQPVSPTRIGPILATLSKAVSEGDAHVRVVTRDGRIAEGLLRAVTPEQLLLIVPGELAPVRRNAADVQSIEMRVPHRMREWALAAFAIVTTTAILVAYARLPWIGPNADALSPFMLLYIVAAAAAPFVLARTRLGTWLTKWRAVD